MSDAPPLFRLDQGHPVVLAVRKDFPDADVRAAVLADRRTSLRVVADGVAKWHRLAPGFLSEPDAAAFIADLTRRAFRRSHA